MEITSIAAENIPRYRLLCLDGIIEREDRDDFQLRLAFDAEVPDFVSNSNLEEGQVFKSVIKDDPIWKVEAAEDIDAGRLVTTASEGKVRHRKYGEPAVYFGYSLHPAKAGEPVLVRRKTAIDGKWVKAIDEKVNSEGSGA